ncbi:hypothetical protein E2C06_11835 [Dankookia rubra]|uniref:Uncharacterized protein n=1 Tax=Dankookia rubra TaxID=1442381 RepID=A0A4R5QI27_9PROT|nr:hypothetical protein [Dankookia rubra]TDH62301.1 hypothetical protein E2C06_11835 [Dankookia rubra]
MAEVTGDLPATTAVRTEPERGAERRQVPASAAARVELVQINFRASKDLAKLISRLSAERGSTRRLFAQLLQNDGHEVPAADLNPPDTRRRYDD